MSTVRQMTEMFQRPKCLRKKGPKCFCESCKKKVVSILPPRCWGQETGWSHCATSRTFSLMTSCNTTKNVTLSGTRCPARGVMVTLYGYYAIAIQWHSSRWFCQWLAYFQWLAVRLSICQLSFSFYLCFFPGSTLVLPLGVSVVRLGLG